MAAEFEREVIKYRDMNLLVSGTFLSARHVKILDSKRIIENVSSERFFLIHKIKKSNPIAKLSG